MGVVSVNQILVALAFITLISEASSNGVVELHEDSWYQVTEGEWMIKFYAPWCPACRSLTNSWSDFAEWTQDLGLDGVAEVDVTRNPGLSGRFLVTALPTVVKLRIGQKKCRNVDIFDPLMSISRARRPLAAFKMIDCEPNIGGKSNLKLAKV